LQSEDSLPEFTKKATQNAKVGKRGKSGLETPEAPEAPEAP
jgi:hypothetical protein